VLEFIKENMQNRIMPEISSFEIRQYLAHREYLGYNSHEVNEKRLIKI
jgi:hypothetical protein